MCCNNSVRQLWHCPVVVVLSLHVGLSWAQGGLESGEGISKSPKKNVMMEEVVVTAQRREQNLADVPIAVTALNGEQLDTLGVTDTQDLNIVVPGFSSSESGYGPPIYTLRGVGFPDSTYFASPTTAVYLDEVALPYSIMSKGPNIDIQRVEILKGPQGTLYGRSTTGGAINYIAEKPSEEFVAGFDVSYGRFDRKDLKGYVGGAMSSVMNYRLAGRVIRQDEPWQYSNTDHNNRLGEEEKYSLRSIFDLDWGGDSFIRVSLSGWRDRSDTQAGQPVYFNAQNPQSDLLASQEVRDYPYIPDTDDPRVAEFCKGHPSCVDASGKPYDFKADEMFYQAAIRASHYFTDSLQGILLLSYNKFEADGTELPAAAYNTRHNVGTIFSEIENIDVEFRLSGVGQLFSNPVNWTAGVHTTPMEEGLDSRFYAASENNSVLYVVPLVGSLPGFDDISVLGRSYFFTEGVMEYQSASLFGNADMQLSDAFKLTIGARYTDEERDFSGCIGGDPRENEFRVSALFTALSVQRALLAGTTPDTTLPGECFTISEDGQFDRPTQTLAEDSLSWRAVVDWTPDDHSLIYLSRSRGFKSGSFPVTNATDRAQYQPAVQEQVDAYEIGAKLNYLDGLLRFNTAAFYYDYTDKQLFSRIQDPLFGSLPQLQNAPSSEVRGIEFDLASSPFSGLYISLAAAYIETEVKDFPNAFNTQGEPEDLTGTEFNYSPKLSYTALLDYSFAVSSYYEAGIGVDYSFKGETNSTLDGDPLFFHDDFGITNARVRFGRNDGKWLLTFYARNVFNEYATTANAQIVSDLVTRYVAMPRTWELNLGWKI